MNKKVVIESMYLYDYNNPENGITVGGSQRYTLDLGRLFFKCGYEVTYLTKAKINMISKFEDWATIVAFDSPYGNKGILDFSKRVYSYCQNMKPDFVCYSDIEIGFPFCYENSFAIQHGIAWDNPYNKLKKTIKSHFYIKAMHNFKFVICVDTNFINWCRERDKYYFNNPEKLIYVPNYADEIQFMYTYNEWTSGDVYKLLYPRRLVEHRGFRIFMEMCDILLKKGYKIEPILAFEDSREEQFKFSYPEYGSMNCKIIHPDMNNIQEYYKQSYLTFIPSRWSEGTSLSAIESISTGCPIIVSDVGGLGNIVLQGFNGYIVPPSAIKFAEITEKLLIDVDKRNELARNCIVMNKIFGKKRWEDQILDVINTYL